MYVEWRKVSICEIVRFVTGWGVMRFCLSGSLEGQYWLLAKSTSVNIYRCKHATNLFFKKLVDNLKIPTSCYNS